MGVTTDLTPSSAALAAEAADEPPRALITAAPRLATVGTKVSVNQAWSVMTSVAGLPPIRAFLKSGYWLSLWLPQIARLLTWPTGTPAFRASCVAARFWSSRVMANQRSAGTLGACDRAIRALVLQGLATVRTRTSGPAASLIAWPLAGEDRPVGADQVGAGHPVLAGHPADEDDPVGPLERLGRLVGRLDRSSQQGKAQSSSSMMVPWSEGRAGVISRRRSETGWSGPKTEPEASRKIVA